MMAARNVTNGTLKCGCLSPGNVLEIPRNVFFVAEAQFRQFFIFEDEENTSDFNLQTYPSQKHGLNSTLVDDYYSWKLT